jgi:hypothetical protein
MIVVKVSLNQQSILALFKFGKIQQINNSNRTITSFYTNRFNIGIV